MIGIRGVIVVFEAGAGLERSARIVNGDLRRQVANMNYVAGIGAAAARRRWIARIVITVVRGHKRGGGATHQRARRARTEVVFISIGGVVVLIVGQRLLRNEIRAARFERTLSYDQYNNT